MYKYLTFPPSVRESYFSRALNALGSVMHHLQDMAQPQHVRNDWHPPIVHPSAYESWADGYYGTIPDIGYPASMVAPDLRSFWTAFYRNGGMTDFLDNTGIADFTNHNFVSIGTNFLRANDEPFLGVPTVQDLLAFPGFPKPNGVGAQVTSIPWSLVENAPGEPPFPVGDPAGIAGNLYFVRTPIIDQYPVPAAYNDRTASWSVYDWDLDRYNIHTCPITSPSKPPGFCLSGMFSLNSMNYKAAADFLIPRAASYSTGLIDYFFRGIARDGQPVLRLQASDIGLPTASLVVRNDSPEALSDGVLEIYYDGSLPGAPGLNIHLGSMPATLAANGGSVTITENDLPLHLLHDTSAKLDGRIAVIYRGTMGSEQETGIAARVCKCPVSGDATEAERECAALCRCQYLAFQQGDPGVPDGLAITPRVGRFTVNWFADDCDTFLGVVRRPEMQLDYPPIGEPPAGGLDAARFASGMTATVFVKPVAGQAVPESLAYLGVSFFESGACGCGGAVLVETEPQLGVSGVGGIPARYSSSAGYTTVNGRLGTYVSLSPGLGNLSCGCADPTASLAGIELGYRSDVRSPCCSRCDDWTPVDVDAVMLCPGELAYPK